VIFGCSTTRDSKKISTRRSRFARTSANVRDRLNITHAMTASTRISPELASCRAIASNTRPSVAGRVAK
jgi:hypothetical protein